MEALFGCLNVSRTMAIIKNRRIKPSFSTILRNPASAHFSAISLLCPKAATFDTIIGRPDLSSYAAFRFLKKN